MPSSNNEHTTPVPSRYDRRGRVVIRTWRDPLAQVFVAEMLLLVMLAAARLAMSGRASAVLVSLVEATALWVLPYAYFGRKHSLRDDRSLIKAVKTHDALSAQDVPMHPSWWREGGEPSRIIIRLTVLGTVPITVAALVFHARLMDAAVAILPHHHPYLPVADGDLPTLVWGAAWLGSFAALSWARSTRRNSFKASVDNLVERETLQPELSERAGLRCEIDELARQRAELREILDELTRANEAVRTEGVSPGQRALFDRIEEGLATIRKQLKDADERAESKNLDDVRRDWRMSIGGVVAGLVGGFLLAILSHQIGLT